MTPHPPPTPPGADGPRPRPSPSPEVLAIVSAALDALMSCHVAATDEGTDAERQAWRFSGRWWNRPLPLRRDRPGP